MRAAAIICSYGHQDYFRIMGRDPLKEPLSELERDILARLLLEIWEAKVAPGSAIQSIVGGNNDMAIGE